MILCHRYELIFIKTRKTASTSVEVALSKLCSAADIVTPLTAEDERARVQAGGRPGVRMPKGAADMTAEEAERARANTDVLVGLYNHVPAAQIRASVGEALWQRYLKVSIERNPWDRLLSVYRFLHWRARDRGNPAPPQDDAAFIDDVMAHAPEMLSNWPLYAIDDAPAIDMMLFTESLDADMARLGARLGTDLALPAQPFKATAREEAGSYRDRLSEAAVERLNRLCAREIEAFGYRF